MYHMSAQGVDERMINEHYYYYLERAVESHSLKERERALPFISLSHSDNLSESATKFYNSFKADVGGGNVLILTSRVLRFDRAESF